MIKVIKNKELENQNLLTTLNNKISNKKDDEIDFLRNQIDVLKIQLNDNKNENLKL